MAKNLSHLYDSMQLVHAIEALNDVATDSDFIAWSSETLQHILPHNMMHCYFGVMKKGRLAPHKWLTKRYPAVCMDSFKDDKGLVMTPFMEGSHASGVVQLFEPDRDTVLSTAELQRFRQFELRNVAAHMQSCTLTGLTSYFSFSQIPEPLADKHAQVLSLLVPQMHAALNHIVGHEQKRAAQPDSVECQLTRREMEVLDWLKEGKTNWEISQILNCSATTVKTHLQRIFAKMGVTSRARAAALWASKVPLHQAPWHGGARAAYAAR